MFKQTEKLTVHMQQRNIHLTHGPSKRDNTNYKESYDHKHVKFKNMDYRKLAAGLALKVTTFDA
jgi:hypothetical protein